MTAASRIAVAYLFMALLGLALVAPTMPPFQNADEGAHLLRADQISHGGLLPRRLPDGEQGGWVDAGLQRAIVPFDGLRFHTDAKVARPMYAPQPWGPLVQSGFPNTAIYPPAFYLPQAVALFTARHLPLTVLQGATLARLAAGLATIALAAAAIALAAGGAIWLYAILLLPMSVALTAAASQDGLILACTALAAALAQRMRRRASLPGLAVAAALFALIACARPPYAAFAVALLLANLPWRPRIVAFAAVLATVLAWSAVAGPHVVLPVFAQGAANPSEQVGRLLHAPQQLPILLAHTWHSYGQALRDEFIGKLGWLDTSLPRPYLRLAWIMLTGAALASIAACRWTRPGAGTAIAACGILAATGGVVMLQYLTWTVPGAPLIEGLQGRYFLPPAIMLVTVLPPGERHISRLWPLQALIMLFPAFSIAVTVHALLIRYYV